MRTIMVMNAKGGCGKSTIATSLATYYANEDLKVTLADFDQQGSSLDWLAVRPADRPPIEGLAGWRSGLRGLDQDTDVLIIDAPARVHGDEVKSMLRRAETVLVPVLPSPIDMRAAAHFVKEVMETPMYQNKEVRLGLVGNRVKSGTTIADELEEFLRKVRMPYVGWLRETQNYNRALARGMGIFELPPYLAWQDWERWDSVVKWLNSQRSLPQG